MPPPGSRKRLTSILGQAELDELLSGRDKIDEECRRSWTDRRKIGDQSEQRRGERVDLPRRCSVPWRDKRGRTRAAGQSH